MPAPKDDSFPTRSSLLRRVKDTRDEQSWQEFYYIYARLIAGFAIKAGLTEDQAQEVVQETMITAAKHLPEFHYDPKVCSFKTWLLNLSAWRVKNQFRKRESPIAPNARRIRRDADDTTQRTDTVERVADPAGDRLGEIWDNQWRTTLLDAALARVKERIDSKQWQIFDLSVLQHWSVKDVAKVLGVSAGYIYLIRHRISSALTKETRRLEKELEQQANSRRSQKHAKIVIAGPPWRCSWKSKPCTLDFGNALATIIMEDCQSEAESREGQSVKLLTRDDGKHDLAVRAGVCGHVR